MRDFFLLLVIGLVFFLPACAVGAKFLAAGNKEKNSYANFLATIESMKDQPDGTAETHTLYLDSGTAVLVFPEGINEVKVHQTAVPPGNTITFFKPDKCESASSCVCRCKEIKGEGGGSYKEDFSCASDTSCQSFNFPVTGICKIEGPHDYKWKCTQGAVIDRGLVEDKDNYLFLGSTRGPDQKDIVAKRRSIIVTIEKNNGMVAVCENPDPNSGCVP